MNSILATETESLDPLSRYWTIEQLLEWLSEDDGRLSDHTLRAPLQLIEEALTGSRWTVDLNAALQGTRRVRHPAVISLVRSIALHCNRHPAARAMTLADVAALRPE